MGAGGWVAGWGVKMEAVVADAEGAFVLAPEEAAAVALALADGCGSFSVLDSSSNTAACDVRMCLCRLLVEPARYDILVLQSLHSALVESDVALK